MAKKISDIKNETTVKVGNKLTSLAKEFKSSKGGGSLSLGSNFPAPKVLPTGIPELDNDILVIGGIAIGRVIEIAGETNAGKTTLALNIAARAIDAGYSVVIAENEGSFTYEYAEKIGMPKDSYHLFKGENLSGPEFLEGIFRLAETGYDFIIMDSLFGIEGVASSEARLVDMKMNTKQSGTMIIANFAKLWKNGWKPFLSKNKGKKVVKGTDSGVTLITINHLKPVFGGFGKEVSGSKDIQFLYSQRIHLERLGMSDDLDENDNPIYTRAKVKCQKSKLSPGGRFTTMCVDNRNGRFLTDSKVIADSAVRQGIVIKAGKWIKVNPEILLKEDSGGIFSCLDVDMKWDGAPSFVVFCNENNLLLERIMKFK